MWTVTTSNALVIGNYSSENEADTAARLFVEASGIGSPTAFVSKVLRAYNIEAVPNVVVTNL